MANIEGKYHAALVTKNNDMLKKLHISENTEKFLKYLKNKNKKYSSMIVPGTKWEFEVFINDREIIEFIDDSYYVLKSEIDFFRKLSIHTNFNMITNLKIDYIEGLVAKVVGEEDNIITYKSYYKAIYTFE